MATSQFHDMSDSDENDDVVLYSGNKAKNSINDLAKRELRYITKQPSINVDLTKHHGSKIFGAVKSSATVTKAINLCDLLDESDSELMYESAKPKVPRIESNREIINLDSSDEDEQKCLSSKLGILKQTSNQTSNCILNHANVSSCHQTTSSEPSILSKELVADSKARNSADGVVTRTTDGNNSDQTEIYLSSDTSNHPTENVSDKTEEYSDNDSLPEIGFDLYGDPLRSTAVPSVTSNTESVQVTGSYNQSHCKNVAAASSQQPTSHTFTLIKSKPTTPRDEATSATTNSASLHPDTLTAKQLAKLRKEEEKQQKKLEKERKALEKQREAAMRKAERESKRAAKPGECHRHMIVEADKAFENTSLGIQLEANCLAQSITLRYKNLPLKNAVLFKRKLHTVPNTVGQATGPSETLENEMALILEMEDVVNLVHTLVQDGSTSLFGQLNLLQYVQRVCDTYQAKPTLLVLGFEKYFRTLKTHTNRVYTDKVLGTTNNSKKNKEVTVISRIDYEESLIELQMKFDVNVINLETEEDVAKSVLRINKSIAEAPVKREKYLMEAQGVKAAGLKINKDGQGSLLVWQRMLQEFRNISADVAGAIIAEWPSPYLLYEQYQRCVNEREAEQLLQDVEVRRGGSVVTTTRRVGKETSRRVYQLFTSKEVTFLIK